jgi:hypothetical protein
MSDNSDHHMSENNDTTNSKTNATVTNGEFRVHYTTITIDEFWLLCENSFTENPWQTTDDLSFFWSKLDKCSLPLLATPICEKQMLVKIIQSGQCNLAFEDVSES